MYKQETDPTYVVGIRATRNGLEAMHQFISSLTFRRNLAFVLACHVSPALARPRDEAVRVVEVIAPTPLEAGNLYVPPQNRSLAVRRGYVSPAPDDNLLRTIADEYQGRAIAVLFPGDRGALEMLDAAGMGEPEVLEAAVV